MPAGAPSLLGRQGRLSPLCVLTNAEAFERAMAQPWLAKPHTSRCITWQEASCPGVGPHPGQGYPQ